MADSQAQLLEKFTKFHQRVALIATEAGGAAKLARKSGLSTGVVLKYKRGESEPTLSRLKALAEAAKVSLNWLATGAGDIYTGKPPPGQASPSTASNESPDDPSMLRQPSPRDPYIPGPPTTDKSCPLTPEEAQFATFQAWKDVIAGTHLNLQRSRQDINTVDAFALANRIAEVLVEYAQAAAAERKNLAERIASSPNIAADPNIASSPNIASDPNIAADPNIAELKKKADG